MGSRVAANVVVGHDCQGIGSGTQRTYFLLSSTSCLRRVLVLISQTGPWQRLGRYPGNYLFPVFLDRQARVEKGMALEVLGLDSTTYAAQVLDPLGQEWVEQSMNLSSACPHTYGFHPGHFLPGCSTPPFELVLKPEHPCLVQHTTIPRWSNAAYFGIPLPTLPQCIHLVARDYSSMYAGQ